MSVIATHSDRRSSRDSGRSIAAGIDTNHQDDCDTDISFADMYDDMIDALAEDR